MTNTDEQVIELARKLYDALETKERNEGERFVTLKDGSPQWMTDVIRAAHGYKLPDDTVYEFCERAAGAFADANELDELDDAISELEPDCYTHHLTAWLDSRVDHVYYLTEALENYGPFDDGFKLLATAQQLHIEEVAHLLLDALRDIDLDSTQGGAA